MCSQEHQVSAQCRIETMTHNFYVLRLKTSGTSYNINIESYNIESYNISVVGLRSSSSRYSTRVLTVLIAKTFILRVVDEVDICTRHHLCNTHIILALKEANLRLSIPLILISSAATTVVVAEDPSAGILLVIWKVLGLVACPVDGIPTWIPKQVANRSSRLEKECATMIAARTWKSSLCNTQITMPMSCLSTSILTMATVIMKAAHQALQLHLSTQPSNSELLMAKPVVTSRMTRLRPQSRLHRLICPHNLKFVFTVFGTVFWLNQNNCFSVPCFFLEKKHKRGCLQNLGTIPFDTCFFF